MTSYLEAIEVFNCSQDMDCQKNTENYMVLDIADDPTLDDDMDEAYMKYMVPGNSDMLAVCTNALLISHTYHFEEVKSLNWAGLIF